MMLRMSQIDMVKNDDGRWEADWISRLRERRWLIVYAGGTAAMYALALTIVLVNGR